MSSRGILQLCGKRSLPRDCSQTFNWAGGLLLVSRPWEELGGIVTVSQAAGLFFALTFFACSCSLALPLAGWTLVDHLLCPVLPLPSSSPASPSPVLPMFLPEPPASSPVLPIQPVTTIPGTTQSRVLNLLPNPHTPHVQSCGHRSCTCGVVPVQELHGLLGRECAQTP